MIKLYFAPRTRALRIAWLLEELELPYELERAEFVPTHQEFFVQKTPLGKFPVLEDGDLVIGESGAIVEYLLERYGEGRLAPPRDTPEWARFLQWLHFAESTAYPPIGIVVWLTLYRDDAEEHPGLIADARERAASGLVVAEAALVEQPYLLGEDFSAADVMMGFTVAAAREMQLLDERFPNLAGYLGRLATRPAFQKALAL